MRHTKHLNILITALILFAFYASAGTYEKIDTLRVNDIIDATGNTILSTDGSADIVSGGIKINASHCYAIPTGANHYIKMCTDDLDMKSDADTRTRLQPGQAQFGSSTNYTLINKVALDIIDASDDIHINIGDTYNGIRIKDASANDNCFFGVNTGYCLNDAANTTVTMGDNGSEYGFDVNNSSTGAFAQINLNGLDFYDGSDYTCRIVASTGAFTCASAHTTGNLLVDGTADIIGDLTLSGGLNVGSDAQGDMYTRYSNALTRVGIGSAGQVWTVNAGGTLPEWDDPPAGVTDHGALTGLTDVADHPGYLTLDGARVMVGDLDMGAQEITSTTTDQSIVIRPNGAGATIIYDSNTNAYTYYSDGLGWVTLSEGASTVNSSKRAYSTDSAQNVQNRFYRVNGTIASPTAITDGFALSSEVNYAYYAGADKHSHTIASHVVTAGSPYHQSKINYGGSSDGSTWDDDMFIIDFSTETFTTQNLVVVDDIKPASGNLNLKNGTGGSVVLWDVNSNGYAFFYSDGFSTKTESGSNLNNYQWNNTGANGVGINNYRRGGTIASVGNISNGWVLSYEKNNGWSTSSKRGMEKYLYAVDVSGTYIQAKTEYGGSSDGTTWDDDMFIMDYSTETFTAPNILATTNISADGVIAADSITSYQSNYNLTLYGAGSGTVHVSDSLNVDTISEHTASTGVTITKPVIGTLTSDPCGTYPAGTTFYSAAGDGFLCYCNDNGDDIRADDSTTACTYP